MHTLIPAPLMNKQSESPTLFFATPNDFQHWLHQHNTSVKSIWLKFAKKSSGIPSITPAEALEIALCYGWIDGQRKTFDEQFYINKYTPRRKGSLWSKRNCKIAIQLIKEKRMTSHGLREINAAKEDGRWQNAYDSSKNIQLPPDFLERLKKSKKAYTFFTTLNKTNTFAIAFRLQTARKPETREKRLQKIIEMMKAGQKFH